MPGPFDWGPTGDPRFYFHAAASLLTLAVIAAVALTISGVDTGQATTIIVAILGFAATIINQYRNASATNAKVDQLSQQLTQHEPVPEPEPQPECETDGPASEGY